MGGMINRFCIFIFTFLNFTNLFAAEVSHTFIPKSACLGGNTVVCITESQHDPYGGVRYGIYNFSAERIYAFGVTNSQKAYFTEAQYPGFSHWDSAQLNASQWNGTAQEGNLFAPIYVFDPAGTNTSYTYLTNTGTKPEQSPDGEIISLGSFEELFGTSELYVNFYWNDRIGLHPSLDTAALNPGTFLDQFYAHGIFPESNFVAFGATGNVIASFNSSTNVSSVPEPQSYAMLIAGLALIVSFTARQKNTLIIKTI